MRKPINYLLILALGIAVISAGTDPARASGQAAGPSPASASKALAPVYQKILQQVAENAANLVYDYDTRPLIRTVVLDFHDPSGRETLVGNELAAYLRAGLDRENQFYVYGREQVQRSLGHFIQVSRGMKPAQVSRLQELVPVVFSKPVHLIVAGEVQPISGNQIQVLVTLIPFFKPLTPVEIEADSLPFPQLSYLTPPLTDEEHKAVLAKPKTERSAAAATPHYGRLIVLSNYLLEKPREQERRYLGTLESSASSSEKIPGPLLRQVDLGNPQDLTCWLDKQELYLFEEGQITNFKDYYHNVLSGFGADQVWFDAEVKGGDHQLAFSVFPGNSLHKKAVSYPFKLKPGATTFLVVSVVSQPQKDPDIAVRMIVDPDNKGYPF